MESRAVDLAELEGLLASATGRPSIVHHFATWCDPCAEELPILARLLEGFEGDVPFRVAVAWDLFMTPVRPEEAVRACAGFLERLGGSFDRLLVYTGEPEALFASQGIVNRTVPFTDVRDASGALVASFPEPIFEEAEQERLLAALRGAATAGDGGAR